jgi:hypothetical protein
MMGFLVSDGIEGHELFVNSVYVFGEASCLGGLIGIGVVLILAKLSSIQVLFLL